MPVQTGYVPDDEMPVSDDQKDVAVPPPAQVAGLDVVANEPTTLTGDEKPPPPPHVVIRSTQRFGRDEATGERVALPNPDARFELRSKVPGMLIMDLASKQARVTSIEDEVAQANLFAALGQSIQMLVVETDRQRFTDHLIAVDPPIELEELVGEDGIIGKMMEAVTARPTPSV